MAGSVGFVDREHELSRLEGALGSDARLVLVVGDAGVGKTRFAGEGMRRAAAGGMVCVLGGCLPLAGALPLLPVADALGELSRLEDGGLLEGVLGMVPRYVRAEVARLLPQLEAGEPGAGGRAWRDPLKGEEFSDGRDAQEVRQGLQGGRGAAGPGDR